MKQEKTYAIEGLHLLSRLRTKCHVNGGEYNGVHYEDLLLLEEALLKKLPEFSIRHGRIHEFFLGIIAEAVYDEKIAQALRQMLKQEFAQAENQPSPIAVPVPKPSIPQKQSPDPKPSAPQNEASLLENIYRTFQEEIVSRWVFFLGAFLITATAILYTLTQWSNITALMATVLVAVIQLSLLVFERILDQGLQLKTSSRLFALLYTLLLPLSLYFLASTSSVHFALGFLVLAPPLLLLQKKHLPEQIIWPAFILLALIPLALLLNKASMVQGLAFLAALALPFALLNQGKKEPMPMFFQLLVFYFYWSVLLFPDLNLGLLFYALLLFLIHWKIAFNDSALDQPHLYVVFFTFVYLSLQGENGFVQVWFGAALLTVGLHILLLESRNSFIVSLSAFLVLGLCFFAMPFIEALFEIRLSIPGREYGTLLLCFFYYAYAMALRFFFEFYGFSLMVLLAWFGGIVMIGYSNPLYLAHTLLPTLLLYWDARQKKKDLLYMPFGLLLSSMMFKVLPFSALYNLLFLGLFWSVLSVVLKIRFSKLNTYGVLADFAFFLSTAFIFAVHYSMHTADLSHALILSVLGLVYLIKAWQQNSEPYAHAGFLLLGGTYLVLMQLGYVGPKVHPLAPYFGLVFSFVCSLSGPHLPEVLQVFRSAVIRMGQILPLFILGLAWEGEVNAILWLMAAVNFEIAQEFRPASGRTMALICLNIAVFGLCPEAYFNEVMPFFAGISCMFLAWSKRSELEEKVQSSLNHLGNLFFYAGAVVDMVAIGGLKPLLFTFALCAAGGLIALFLKSRQHFFTALTVFALSLAIFTIQQLFLHSTNGMVTVLLLGLILVAIGVVLDKFRQEWQDLWEALNRRFEGWKD